MSWLMEIPLSREREEPDRYPDCVAVDTLQVGIQELPDGDLPGLGDVDELAPLADEQIFPVGGQLVVKKRMRGGELLSEILQSRSLATLFTSS